MEYKCRHCSFTIEANTRNKIGAHYRWIHPGVEKLKRVGRYKRKKVKKGYGPKDQTPKNKTVEDFELLVDEMIKRKFADKTILDDVHHRYTKFLDEARKEEYYDNDKRVRYVIRD